MNALGAWSRHDGWRRTLWLAAALVAVLAGAWWAYHPGLSGGFQFDDYANLPALGASGPVDDWATFWRYITSGHADPTGRPVALLSFLLDARNWPADPRPFLQTSIWLHLVNGALLFALLQRLGRLLARTTAVDGRDRRLHWRVDAAALAGAGLWLVHPLMVSTTLYIVQREAMLPATFTLLGLLAWLRGRQRLLDGATLRGLAWLVLGLGVCTALGVLSKANGILSPALALVVEWTILRGRSRGIGPTSRPPRIYRWAMLVLAGLPTAFVAWYLAHRGVDGFVHGISGRRPWTLGQRLLTEPRVLMDYLQLLWLPRPFTPGLFNDQIHASLSLLAPWTTLPCLLAVLGMIAGACVLHRRWPALALAVLFYFVGQALESSTVPLELYYEHRNYLPAMLMFWPLALWLCGVPQIRRRRGRDLPPESTRRSVDLRWLKLGLALLVLVGLAAMTHARTALWGNTHEQALMWARLNPDSPRAQANAAMAQMHAGHPAKAVPRLRTLLARDPSQVQLALNLFGAQCRLGRVPPSTLRASRKALATTHNPGSLLSHWFSRAIAGTAHPACPQLTLDTLGSLVQAALGNPRLQRSRGRLQDLYSIQGQIALARHQPDRALVDFDRALSEDLRASAAFEQAALLGSAGYPRRGLAHLARFRKQRAARVPSHHKLDMRRIHAWVLRREHYWQREGARLRRTLEHDAADKATGTTGIAVPDPADGPRHDANVTPTTTLQAPVSGL